jgi:hypothetical protein
MTKTHATIECGNCGTPIGQAHETPEVRQPCPNCGSLKRNRFFTMGSMQPSPYLLDNYFAHKLSELTECGAEELIDQEKWLNTFILKSIVHFNLQPNIKAYLFNFLRRTEGANAAYRDARRMLQEHLATPRMTVSPYFKSLTHFEICIAQCYQGYELLASAMGGEVYVPGSATVEERLQIVYVDSKHMDRMIHGEKLPVTATSGIWITNTGLESSRGSITFKELHGLLSQMHNLAEKICTASPPAATE